MAKRATESVSVRHLVDAPRASQAVHREREQKRQERRGKLLDSGKFHFLFIRAKSRSFSFFYWKTRQQGIAAVSRCFCAKALSVVPLNPLFFAISSFSRICLALEKAKVGAANQDFLVFIDMMLGP